MDLTQEDVVQILKIIEDSNMESFVLEMGDLKIMASKNGVAPTFQSSSTPQAVEPAAVPAKAAGAETPPPPAPSSANRGSAPVEAVNVEGLETVKSPMVGTFYAAPEPGAPPFVAVGARVDADTTMGLIEVMKVFNSVSAGVRGELVRVLVENEQFVEYGQPLFLIKPEMA